MLLKFQEISGGVQNGCNIVEVIFKVGNFTMFSWRQIEEELQREDPFALKYIRHCFSLEA